MSDDDPGELADALEGVFHGVEAALMDREVDVIGRSIQYLRAEADRRDGIAEKLDRAARTGGNE